jgi:hypothetical protein
MRALVHRVVAAVFAALSVGAIWLLWESRPHLQAVGGGGAAIFGLSPGSAACCSVGLLFRVVARDRRETTASLPIRTAQARRSQTPRPGPATDRAFPLITTGGAAGAQIPARLSWLLSRRRWTTGRRPRGAHQQQGRR